jgi:hypothetical protein
MVDVPDPINFHFNFGFPSGTAYDWLAETITLALEGRFEDYTLGKSVARQHVEEITAMAAKHRFRLSGFCSFERDDTEEQIEPCGRASSRRTDAVKREAYYGKSTPISCRR